jgi:hypothetical protein
MEKMCYLPFGSVILRILFIDRLVSCPSNFVNPWNFTECFYLKRGFYLNYLELSTNQNFFLKMNSYKDLFYFSTDCVIFFLTIFKLLHRIKTRIIISIKTSYYIRKKNSERTFPLVFLYFHSLLFCLL